MEDAKVGAEDRVWSEELPPQYSQEGPGTPSTSSPARQMSNVPRDLPLLPYHKYRLRDSTLSADEVSVTVKDPRYAEDSLALARMLSEQAALPPRPILRVRGWWQTDMGRRPIYDFDVEMNLTGMIWREPERGSLNYVKLAPGGAVAPPRLPSGSKSKGAANLQLSEHPTIEQWAERFCSDPSPAKRIMLTRKMVNLDTEYISGALRNMISSLNYKGNVRIEFSEEHSEVIYQSGELTIVQGIKKFWSALTSPSASGSGSKSKATSDPGQGFKDYDVIESIWPFATVAADEVVESNEQRRFAVASEAAWWQTWKVAWRNAVLTEKKGSLGMSDWVAAAMGRVVPEKKLPWGEGY